MSAHFTLVSMINEENIINKLKLKRDYIQTRLDDTLQFRAEIIGLNREIGEREGALFAFMSSTSAQYQTLGDTDDSEAEQVLEA